MEIQKTVQLDLNRLADKIRDAAGTKIPVRFSPLLPGGLTELSGRDRVNAAFATVWIAFVGDGKTLKLHLVSGNRTSILGLVRLGEIIPGEKYMRNYLLESLPESQYGQSQRTYQGIGRVLMARLAAESYN